MVEVRRGRRVLPRLRVLVVGVRRGRRGTLHRLGVVALVVGQKVPRVGRRELGVVALLVAGRRARLVSRRRRVLALAVLALGLAARAAGTLLLPVVLALVVAHRVLEGPLPGVVVPRQR